MISYTKKINQLNIKKIIENNFHTNDCQIFWENNKTKETIFAFGCIDKIEMDKKSDINFIKQEIDEKLNNITDSKGHANSYPKFFGGFSFNNDIKNNNWVSFPRGCFILPKCIIESNKHETTMTLIKKNQKKISPQTIEKEMMGIYEKLKKNKSQGNILNEQLILNQKKEDISKLDYIKKINKIIDEIKLGTIEKLVLSRVKYLNFEGDINFSALIKRMQKSYPQCINFFIKIPDKGIFFGSTPEQLIKKNNNTIKSEAIAGTTKRDNNPNKDLLFENELKNDSKSLEEHEFVVKEIEKILKPKLSKIILSDKPSILKLKNIQHLVTNIAGKLKKNIHILELVKGLHPTPAVSGYPVEKASKLINKYEEHDRGWYSSPFGWINSDGDGDFCVALRSSLIVGKTIQLFSGGGIVLNSNPDREWEETELKMKTILEIIKDNISYEN